MANLSIAKIGQRIFNTSLHEKSVARSSNPFAASSFKGNVLTADVFESSKATTAQAKDKLTYSTLVGSIANVGNRIQKGIESVIAFGNRMKEGIANAWNFMKQTEVSFEPAKKALNTEFTLDPVKKAMGAAAESIKDGWSMMFDKFPSAKQISQMPIAEIRPMLVNEEAAIVASRSVA